MPSRQLRKNPAPVLAADDPTQRAYQRLRDFSGLASGFVVGVACQELGETRRAIAYYEQALAIFREIGDCGGEGCALFNMSVALDKVGERTQAIARAETALKIFEEIEDPYAAKVQKQLAE
jgi:tetratricopeptide (TPR) repeat protein